MLDDLGPHDRGQDAAGHDQRNRASALRGMGGFGSGKTEVLRDAEAESRRHRAETVEREICSPNACSKQQAARQ